MSAPTWARRAAPTRSPVSPSVSTRKSVGIEDLLDLPLIVSRQGSREDIPKLLGEEVDRLRVTATVNLTYNGSVMVRERLGYLLTFDKLVNVLL